MESDAQNSEAENDNLPEDDNTQTKGYKYWGSLFFRILCVLLVFTVGYKKQVRPEIRSKKPPKLSVDEKPMSDCQKVFLKVKDLI